MEYKNTKTGVTFSSPCVVSGGDWVLVEKTKEPTKQEIPQVIDEEQQEEQQEAIESKTGDENFDSITVPQIKQELDAFGIEYNPRAKKQELYDLMMAQGE
ncbi:hypothetical protein ACFC3P_02385 [Enterococcus thailandicus]|uniref:hypothetical protein n=1 Tax=Enterococcus thailandicus TaxID=417368 RepID=UPI0039A46E91